jgi:hypothetical protein
MAILSYNGKRCQYDPVYQGDYTCLFPCCCAKPFRRHCDLERHYEIAHPAPGADPIFLCDYPGCGRGKSPFARRAYFRDHLKEQHKEAIKHGRRREGLTCSERTSNEPWWRCGRCLKRIYFDTEGYNCTSCKTKCRARLSRNKAKTPVNVDELASSME